MQTAKLFVNGASQAVRLPKEYRFSGDEVGIVKMGAVVVLYPRDNADTLFYSSLGTFTDDVFTAIEQARTDAEVETHRETL